MSVTTESADRFRNSCLEKLHGTVRYDRALWGVGRMDEQKRCMQIAVSSSVQVSIVEGHARRDPEGDEFMLQYNVNWSQQDVIGRLFVHMPKVVQVVDVKKATANKSTAEFWQYLENAGIAHLLLVGTFSSFGYAWITLYRDAEEEPFGLHQVEYASRSVPDFLYRWQLLVEGLGDEDNVVLPEQDITCPPTTSSLTNREELVLLGFMNGQSADEIAAEVAAVEGRGSISVDVVYQTHKAAKKKLNGADDSPIGLFGGHGRKMALRTF